MSPIARRIFFAMGWLPAAHLPEAAPRCRVPSSTGTVSLEAPIGFIRPPGPRAGDGFLGAPGKTTARLRGSRLFRPGGIDVDAAPPPSMGRGERSREPRVAPSRVLAHWQGTRVRVGRGTRRGRGLFSGGYGHGT